MTKEELRSYRLNSMEEPTDEMLQAIMEGVAEAAKQSSENAKKELERMKQEAFKRIAEIKKTAKTRKCNLIESQFYASSKAPMVPGRPRQLFSFFPTNGLKTVSISIQITLPEIYLETGIPQMLY